MSLKNHWESAYSTKAVKDRSWSESGESDALDEFDLSDLSIV